VLFRSYPNDPRTEQIVLHASELSFAQKQFARTIDLTGSITDAASVQAQMRAGDLKARSLLGLGRYTEAEETYHRLLGSGQVRDKNKRELEDGLALCIYKQGEIARDAGDRKGAFTHFTRIVRAAPSSDIAATGLYDATAMAINAREWNSAISAIKTFQEFFPNHKYSADVAKKLSVAYLKSNQDIKAAETLEKVSDLEQDREVKMAALWQAAKLHKSKNNLTEAARLLDEYVRNFKDPYPQYLEAMYMLVEIHETSGAKPQANSWRRKIVEANGKAYKGQKNDRTQFIASSAALSLARQRHAEFNTHQLVEPLDANLRKKKAAMQDAVLLYGQASAFGMNETTTEATYAIAEIYESFGKALLKSERPKHLKPREAEQYEILLEDQAFPFEAKAIEFHETNLGRVKDGSYNEWIGKSFAKLRSLFPVRYARTEKIDSFFNVVR
jgi:cellulose synthase operon protein C